MTKHEKVAQANANTFGVPYVVFCSTMGTRVERYDEGLTCHRGGKVFRPQLHLEQGDEPNRFRLRLHH